MDGVSPDFAQVREDIDALRLIFPGMQSLERRMQLALGTIRACERGYFTPDEDDLIRAGWVAYRNYRKAVYEIIQRYLGYARIPDMEHKLRCFLVGFAAALTLYARSLRLIKKWENNPLVRSKLNEPEPKFDLQGGFFDEIVAGCIATRHYRLAVGAHHFWLRHRRQIARLRAEGADWAWLCELISTQRISIRRHLPDLLRWRIKRHGRTVFRFFSAPMRFAALRVPAWLAGRLTKPQALGIHRSSIDGETLDWLRERLQPADVLLVRADHRVTTAVLPGFWTHAALYAGDWPDLLRLGAQDHVRLFEQAARLERTDAWGWVVEAVSPRVAVRPLERCLQADHVAILRPALPPAERLAALADAMGHLGKPYDFEFDFNVSHRMVCTELIYRSFHGRGTVFFQLVRRLGRWTLTGDDLVRQVLVPQVPDQLPGMRVVALAVKGGEGGTERHDASSAHARLLALSNGWRPRPVAPAVPDRPH